jgi:Family of unknown function (DUF5677)
VGQAWPGRELRPGTVERPLAVLFARTTRTYWATVQLLRISFGDQAAMLTRSLFEDMVDLHYICVEPEAAIDRLLKNAEHADMVMIDALKDDPALLAGEPLADYDPARRAELNSLFGPFGEKAGRTSAFVSASQRSGTCGRATDCECSGSSSTW